MKKVLFVLVVLGIIIGCAQTSVRECRIACKSGVREYSDDNLTCKCFSKEDKP